MGETRPSLVRQRRPLTGPLVGLAVGVPILLAGFLFTGEFSLPSTVPVLDTATVACLLVTAAIAGLDARLQADRRSLSIAAIGAAMTIVWLVHLVIFPGDVPGFETAFLSNATSAIFLSVNLTLPFMLAGALFLTSGPLAHPSRALAATVGIGVAIGVALTAVAMAVSAGLTTVTVDGSFTDVSGLVGLAGLVPAIIGLTLYLAGWRGDERVSAGVAAALVLTACNSVLLFFLEKRYTAAWYADHLLALLPAVALLASQMAIFADALRREQRSASALRTSLEMAEAMASQIDLTSLIERLMAGAMRAVAADRATLMIVEGDDLRIEASLDRTGAGAPIGHRLPISSLQVDRVPIVVEAIRQSKAIATHEYDRSLLAPDHGATVEGVRHYITWPLFLGGEVDAVLFLARRRDLPFDTEDANLLSEFATIAALLLRNARLLRSAEAASIAKSSFLNMAAHELRTPVSVIRGYLDLLASGDFGPLARNQQEALGTVTAKAVELSGQLEQLLIASRAEVKPDPDTRRTEVVELSAVVKEAVERAQPRAKLLGATVELVANGTVHALASPAEIGLVVDNLINNAITYSRPPARVQVEVDANGGPNVRVRDDGIGIPPDQQARIFEQFHRIDRPDFAYPGGTGLGLYISRQLASANGGSVELEWSEVDKGSSFVLKLRPAESERAPEYP